MRVESGSVNLLQQIPTFENEGEYHLHYSLEIVVVSVPLRPRDCPMQGPFGSVPVFTFMGPKELSKSKEGATKDMTTRQQARVSSLLLSESRISVYLPHMLDLRSLSKYTFEKVNAMNPRAGRIAHQPILTIGPLFEVPPRPPPDTFVVVKQVSSDTSPSEAKLASDMELGASVKIQTTSLYDANEISAEEVVRLYQITA
ncbi:hypothetical protein P154DRAFT_539476 [Amniculicola lignicola CBS 123094]|uniref:Uncharacterized protein n=1 Tax=Amniculicola lignicola CBS 123094 TaxID=1392246 RepID=A0A6A5W0N0_9PLEO|nr:hypothetical protein P154DRAFT_539476 [Amniculicola lignicola CBS 123094]